MAQDRVDKSWQTKGLGAYATEAILATLGHYGVAVDEPGFHLLASQSYPLGIAQRWAQRWSGSGQFKTFPAAAAAELWRRLEIGRTAPSALAEALSEVLTALRQVRRGVADAPVRAAFQKMEALLPRLPRREGALDGGFVAEAMSQLPEDVAKALDSLAETLAREGHADAARSFAALEEALLPEREGVSRAVVQAALGEREPALKTLWAIARDEGRAPLGQRIAAIEALGRLDPTEEVVAIATRLAAHVEEWAAGQEGLPVGPSGHAAPQEPLRRPGLWRLMGRKG